MTNNIIPPTIYRQIFDKKTFKYLKTTAQNIPKTLDRFNTTLGRYNIRNNDLKKFAEKYITPLAREHFKNNEIVLSSVMLSEYDVKNANLPMHYDLNFATYSFNICVYQSEPWGLWIEEVEYILEENDAVAFNGESALHGRKKFPDHSGNVAILFCHYVEPDHWFITKGPGYIQVVRGEMTEYEYDKWIKDGNVFMLSENSEFGSPVREPLYGEDY